MFHFSKRSHSNFNCFWLVLWNTVWRFFFCILVFLYYKAYCAFPNCFCMIVAWICHFSGTITAATTLARTTKRSPPHFALPRVLGKMLPRFEEWNWWKTKTCNNIIHFHPMFGMCFCVSLCVFVCMIWLWQVFWLQKPETTGGKPRVLCVCVCVFRACLNRAKRLVQYLKPF